MLLRFCFCIVPFTVVMIIRNMIIVIPYWSTSLDTTSELFSSLVKWSSLWMWLYMFFHIGTIFWMLLQNHSVLCRNDLYYEYDYMFAHIEPILWITLLSRSVAWWDDIHYENYYMFTQVGLISAGLEAHSNADFPCCLYLQKVETIDIFFCHSFFSNDFLSVLCT